VLYRHFKLAALFDHEKENFLERYMLPQQIADLYNFARICVLKFVVTEGEKLMIFYFTASKDAKDPRMMQEAAELGLVANLISIVCRFIFQPLEEIAFNVFSKLQRSEAPKEPSSAKESKDDDDENEPNSKPDEAVRILVQYMAAMLGIGACAIMFSQVCSEQFIHLAFSKRWATPSTVRIMQAYCGYLMFMAANGMSEAFAYGLANEAVLLKLQGLMIINAAFYIALNLSFSSYFGIIGLVYANCINMGVRAVWSLSISLSDHNRDRKVKTSPAAFWLKVVTHQYFIGLVVLGAVGTVIAQHALNYLLQRFIIN